MKWNNFDIGWENTPPRPLRIRFCLRIDRQRGLCLRDIPNRISLTTHQAQVQGRTSDTLPDPGTLWVSFREKQRRQPFSPDG